MKRVSIAICTLIFSASVMAQKTDSWKVFHNRKEVASFKFSEDNDERRLVLLNRALEEPGFVIITFKPAAEQADWNRNFVITDSIGKELKKFNNTPELRSHNSEFSRLMEGRNKLQVYTWAVPKDPDQAASVRIRRILLCTIYSR